MNVKLPTFEILRFRCAWNDNDITSFRQHPSKCNLVLALFGEINDGHVCGQRKNNNYLCCSNGFRFRNLHHFVGDCQIRCKRFALKARIRQTPITWCCDRQTSQFRWTCNSFRFLSFSPSLIVRHPGLRSAGVRKLPDNMPRPNGEYATTTTPSLRHISNKPFVSMSRVHSEYST